MAGPWQRRSASASSRSGSQFRAARTLLERAGAVVIGASVVVDETDPALRPALGKFTALIAAADLSP